MDSSIIVEARPVQSARAARRRLGLRARLGWGLAAAAQIAVVALSVWLTPDPRGFGTHEQLGRMMGPCGWQQSTGYPCPTCGMTTAFADMAHGRLVSGFLAQPAGAILFVLVVVGACVSAFAAVCGRAPRINWNRVPAFALALGLALVFLGGWGFKIAHGLLTGSIPAR